MTIIQFTIPRIKVRITYGTLLIVAAALWLVYEPFGLRGLVIMAACALGAVLVGGTIGLLAAAGLYVARRLIARQKATR